MTPAQPGNTNAFAPPSSPGVGGALGPWEPLTLIAAKVEKNATGGEPLFRLENFGTSVRLAGELKVKAGQTVAVNELFASVSEAASPGTLKRMGVFINSANQGLEVTTAGGLKIITVAVAEGLVIYLDGLDFGLK